MYVLIFKSTNMDTNKFANTHSYIHTYVHTYVIFIHSGCMNTSVDFFGGTKAWVIMSTLQAGKKCIHMDKIEVYFVIACLLCCLEDLWHKTHLSKYFFRPRL